MAGCPHCAGTSRRPITPGYFECTSSVLQGMVPQPGVGERPVYGVCGHRYRQGSGSPPDAPVCPCGQFAIGSCAECGTPRCGDHGLLSGSRFRCRSHLAAEETLRRKRATASMQAAATAVSDWLASFLAPEERLLAACLHLGREREKRGPGDRTPSQIVWSAPEVLQDAFEELDRQKVQTFFRVFGGTEDSISPPVSSPHLIEWFRERARAAGCQPSHRLGYGRMQVSRWSGREKKVLAPPTPGWKLNTAFVVAGADHQQALTADLSVSDCREMGRILQLPAPPLDLLNAWSAAAGRIYELQEGPVSGSPVLDALKSQ
jgi:hypothetical protein